MTLASALRSHATMRFMLSHPLHVLSFSFGIGLLPVMPGTAGTLLGWVSFIILNRYLSGVQWWVLITVSFVAGCGFTGFTARCMGVKDPSAAVWDEVVAIWLVLLFIMPTSFSSQLSSFLIFRFFDIVKPPPIRFFEKRFSGGFSIMCDDIIAAFFTLLVIALFKKLFIFNSS
ncbi:phosphatidylglycerophosphatase A [Candidatus Vallotia cooleyia]|uniref:phosphatidylglycerophosphatase A family protein n=1 Tax=Candidatus Vallotiella adelgis TaxID=1177211 RepID=UPI001D027216|nr:phosphatidylglycerophosphatase A [Candidatus Vallotia cooleyia]UDG82190.1 Phosphatidylglycerophosphatase A [Candidatus Vallotia cooleyia]